MEIQLDEEYRIVTVPLNFVLQYYSTVTRRGTGIVEKQWIDVGYYGSNLKSLFVGYLRKSMIECHCESIEELIKTIDKVEKTIKELDIPNNIIL